MVTERNGWFIEGDVLVKYRGKESVVTVPYGIRRVAPLAFKEQGVVKVTLPETVRELDTGAFHRCGRLKEVVLNEGLTRIGRLAFSPDTRLWRVNLPESLTEMGEDAFFGCDALTAVTLPPRLTTVPQAAFGGSGLRSLRIPGTVKKVSYGAFTICRDLGTVYVEEGVEEIGTHAFSECPHLKIYIPFSVKKLSRYTFLDGIHAVSRDFCIYCDDPRRLPEGWDLGDLPVKPFSAAGRIFDELKG